MSDPPRSDVLYEETIVWKPAYALTALFVLIGIVQLFNDWRLAAVLLFAAFVLMWFCVARYTVSRQGIDVRVGAGWPHLKVDIVDIASVTPSHISIMTAGGWGYRGSWTLLRGVVISLGGRGAVLITTNRGKRLQLASHHPHDLFVAASSLAP